MRRGPGCEDGLPKTLESYTLQGRQMTIAQLLTRDGTAADAPTTRFVDRHNGWGLSALHIAVFQGSVQTGGC